MTCLKSKSAAEAAIGCRSLAEKNPYLALIQSLGPYIEPDHALQALPNSKDVPHGVSLLLAGGGGVLSCHASPALSLCLASSPAGITYC